MFKQLTYFQYLQDDLGALQERSADLNRLLVDAYSPPQRVYCSLRQQIDCILSQQQQLQQVLSVILQQIDSCTFLPHQLDPSLHYPSQILPQWFPHVLEKEYARHRPELDSFARNLAALHELREKGKRMREERQNLETLYRRTLVISALQKGQHFSDIDIMQDVNHLRNRVKHVRKALQHFCTQVAEKVRQYVQTLSDKTSQFGKQKIEANKYGHYMANPYFINELPEQSFKKQPILSVRSNLNSPREYRQESTRDSYGDYYSRAEQITTKNKGTPSHNLPTSFLRSSCKNHEQTPHRHTCDRGREWLRSSKSQDRFLPSPSASLSPKFNFRRFVPPSF